MWKSRPLTTLWATSACYRDIFYYYYYYYLFPFWLPLEHGTFIQFSFSLQFLNLGQSVGLPGGVISSSHGLYLHTTTQT
jgi:hypothetical protein